MKKYAYAWVTLAFFGVSLLLHWLFGYLAFVEEHGSADGFVIEMLRDTFENWQSEFLQLLWQVCGLAWFLYIGSPASRDGNERIEHKLDALLQARGMDDIQKKIDKEYMRK